MKNLLQSRVFTRRETLNFLALGAVSIATANALTTTRGDDNASVNINHDNHKQSSSAVLPFVLSF